MDNFVYDIFISYFQALKGLGYVQKKSTYKLLVLNFLYNITYYDYRGYLSRDDYHTIEQALDCLYGSTCLIPYPDYLKMGKLRLGEMTELATRAKNLEAYSENLNKRVLDNDVLIEDNIRRLDEHGGRLDSNDQHLALHDKHLADHDDTLTLHGNTLSDHAATLGEHGEMLVSHNNRISQNERDIDKHENVLTDHGQRISTLENTKAMQNKDERRTIPDIDFNAALS